MVQDIIKLEKYRNFKKSERKRKKSQVDIQVKMEGNNKLQQLSLNTIFKLLYSIETKWTNKQREIINYLIFKKSKSNRSFYPI